VQVRQPALNKTFPKKTLWRQYMGANVKVKNIVGIDTGKKWLEVVRLNGDDKIERFKTRSNHDGEADLFRWLKSEDTVVLEAGNQAFRIAKRIRKLGNEVIVLNPGDVATIYASLKKTDKEDALKLAKLVARHPREELPEVSIPTDEEEDARRLTTEQAFWTESATQCKNRLHSLFIQAGLTDITKRHLSSHKSREKSISLLPERYREEALRIIEILQQLDNCLRAVEAKTIEILNGHKEYTAIAMSIPGVGPVTTLAFLAYIGDCKRFSRGKQVSYYVGLVPSVDISGDTVRYGNIVKRGCVPIRRVVIQGAKSLVRARYGGKLKEFYENHYHRLGKGKAIVAVARKMMETFYAMIKNGESYRGVPLDFINEKFKMYGLT
jgi:transposase